MAVPASGTAQPIWQARHRRASPFLLISTFAGFFALQTLAPALLIPVSLGLFLLGIPHGAVERDPLGEIMRGRVLSPSLAYSALYLVFGVITFASWLIAPWPTLLIALGLSAWHFALPHREPLGIGIFVVGACFAAFPQETLSLFGQLTGQSLTLPSSWLTGLGALAIAALWLSPGFRHNWVVRLILTVIFLTIHPVAAVATYFFFCHSLGESASMLDQERHRPPWQALLRIYAPTSLPALFGATGLLSFTGLGYVPVPMAAGLAIAFIVPHMLPVEKLLKIEREAAKPSKAQQS